MNQKQHKRSAFSGKIGFRSLRCRRVGGPRQHLALSLSCGQVRRRHLPAHLHHPRLHLRLHHDRGRDGAGPDDQEKPGGRVRLLRQKGRAFLRRLDQRHHPHPHRALLLGHRRLGHPVSGRLHRRPRQRAGGGRLFLRLHFQRRCRRRSASSSLPSLPSPSSLRACATAWSGCPR